MGIIFRRVLSQIPKYRVLLLFVFFWCTGLSLGIYFAVTSGESFFLLMRTVASSRVSIVGLFASVYLPFLLSALAVYFGKPVFLFAICFMKAVMFAWCTFACVCAYQSAGWLVRILIQFSDLLLLPVLCWFALRQLYCRREIRRDFSICTALFLLVGSLDYCIVSPFLVMLIDN